MTPLEKKLAIGGFVVAVGSFGIAAIEFSRSSSPPPPQQSPSPPSVVLKVEPPPPAAPPPRIPRLLTEQTIGRQLEFFEAIAGPAQRVEGNRRSYQVDGCDIELEIGSEQQIEGLSVGTTGACSFEWRDLAHNMVGLGRPEQTTLGQFLNYVGTESISHLGGCASSCGNAVAPEIWLQRTGSHADGFIDVTVAVNIDTMRKAELLGRLSSLVEQNLGRDATYDLTQTCDRRVIGWIGAALGELRIERVMLRTQIAPITPTSCDLTRL